MGRETKRATWLVVLTILGLLASGCFGGESTSTQLQASVGDDQPALTGTATGESADREAAAAPDTASTDDATGGEADEVLDDSDGTRVDDFTQSTLSAEITNEDVPVADHVRAAVVEIHEATLEAEAAAQLGDAEAWSNLEVSLPPSYLTVMQQDREWVEGTQGRDFQIDERTFISSVETVREGPDGTVEVVECLTVTDDHLRWGAERDGTPPMAFETRVTQYTPNDTGGWDITDFHRPSDGVFGSRGCVPRDHRERIGEVTTRVLEFMFDTLADPELLMTSEIDPFVGNPLRRALLATKTKVRNLYTITEEPFMVIGAEVDTELTWNKPIPGGFIYRVTICQHFPQGRIYQQVGSSETKPDPNFPEPDTVTQIWLVQSTLGANGQWVDKVINGIEMERGSDCWEAAG